MSHKQPAIAIVPADYTAADQPLGFNAPSLHWRRYLEARGCLVREVDPRDTSILARVGDCDGFMWRFSCFGGMTRVVRRLLPILEYELGLPVYPDHSTRWHYDDKIAQAWLFDVLDIPAPKTSVFFDRQRAEGWLRSQNFPLVMKLANGAGSRNVRLVQDYNEACALIELVFGSWVKSLELPRRLSTKNRLRTLVRQVLMGRPERCRDDGADLQTGYALFQEFLPDNPFDTRITVVGNRAFGFRRYNRPGDFRASGSGVVDYDPSNIDKRFVLLAFKAAQCLKMQSCAIDGLYRDGEPVLGEVSFAYVSGNVYECPGHWCLDGLPVAENLTWVPGHMWPEEAQIQDFVVRVHDFMRRRGA